MNTFEDRLLTELQAVVAERAGQAAKARGDELGRIAGRPAFRPAAAGQRWRPRGLVAAGIAASVALAGALAGTELAASNPAGPATSQYSLVDDFLNQAAAAARTQTVAQPGPNQLYVTLSYGIGMVIVGGNGHIRNDTSCEVSWYNPVGRPIMTIVWGVKPAADKQCKDVSVQSPGKRFKPFAPRWYPAPATLSRDPRTLLTQLDAAADRGAAYWGLSAATGPASTRDQIAFTLVERLLQAPIADDLRAALYRATIGIPGVTLDRHAVDAAGRSGTGVSMRLPDGAGSFSVSEFILARNFAFLGTKTTAPGMPIPMQSALVRSVIVPANGA
ncbi:MAG: hypothetical protein ABSA02_14410 [Trebonia sp.]|jgi:hypothetical protein